MKNIDKIIKLSINILIDYIIYIMCLETPIYCINLIDRPDRKEHVIHELNKLNIDLSKVIFPFCTKDIRGGKYGCYDSHVKIWKEFYLNRKHNFCLILEDDFISHDNRNNILKKGEIFMESNYKEVDFLFLHNLYIKNNDKIFSDYFAKGFGALAHAYFISRNYIENLIKKNGYNWMNPDGLDIDISINCNRKHALYSDKCYFTNINVFTQVFNPSNNCNTFIDIIYRIPFFQYASKDIIQNFLQLSMSLNMYNENELKDIIFNIYIKINK